MNRRNFLATFPPIAAALLGNRLLPVMDDRARAAPDYSASMWIYLWDLVDEGYENVLGRLKDHGLTSISLATAYHAGKFLAPHNPKRKVVFLEDGTVYFSPNSSLYGRIHPVPHSLVLEGHGLKTVKENAQKHGLETRAWVVCCHNTRIGTKYPDTVCETAFGDKLFHNLCPSNDDVRTYIRSLIQDVAAQGADVIELEALQFQGYGHGFHHEREGIELTLSTRFLLGLCFCPSCVNKARAAIVAIGQVRSFVVNTLSAHFERPRAVGDRVHDLNSLPRDLFEPFLEWRRTVILSLLNQLKDVAGPTPLRPMVSLDPTAREMAGVDVDRTAAATRTVLALGYFRDGEVLREPLSALIKTIGSADVTVGFQVGLPESGGRKEFLDRMCVARQLGVRSFNFYNYGFIPLTNLEWITESLRD